MWFCNLNEKDWEGQVRYVSDEEMYKVFSNYYPNKEVNKTTIVKIIKYKITELGGSGQEKNN